MQTCFVSCIKRRVWLDFGIMNDNVKIFTDLTFQEELLAVLTMMVGANISPEQLLSIAERTILEADQDNDDLISFEEFVNVMERTDVEQKMSIRFLN